MINNNTENYNYSTAHETAVSEPESKLARLCREILTGERLWEVAIACLIPMRRCKPLPISHRNVLLATFTLLFLQTISLIQEGRAGRSVNYRPSLAATIGGSINMLQTIYMPSALPLYVAMEAFVVLTFMFKAGKTAQLQQTRLIEQKFEDQTATTSIGRMSLLIISLAGAFLEIHHAGQLIAGVRTAMTLDSVQIQGATQNGAIHHLWPAGSAPCTAVVVGPRFDDYSHLGYVNPLLNSVYEACETHYYQPNDTSSFLTALPEAVARFGRPIDILATFGHANSVVQELGSYIWTGTDPEEFDAMRQFLSTDAQILILGCQSGKEEAEQPMGPLAELVSANLPNKTVVGIASLLYTDHATLDCQNRFCELHVVDPANPSEGNQARLFRT